jgi:non-heme Fe2+,alpha-ketoglutarate-dependent halogenase
MSYADDGYAGPFVALEPSHMCALGRRLGPVIDAGRNAAEIASAVEADRSGEVMTDVEAVWNSHLSHRAVFELATLPAVLAAVTDVAGPDLLLWRTAFWIKEPGTRRIEWHQDTYKAAGLGPRGIVTAWIAIDEVSAANAVRLVAGTHKTVLPSSTFQEPAYVEALRQSPALPPPPTGSAARPPIAMTLRPGAFFVFDQLILHGSPPNVTDSRRVGLVARFLPADADSSGISDPCIAVTGDHGDGDFNLVGPPPKQKRWRFLR